MKSLVSPKVTEKLKDILINLPDDHKLKQLCADPPKLRQTIQTEMLNVYTQIGKYNIGLDNTGCLVELTHLYRIKENNLMCMLKHDMKSDYFDTTKMFEWLVRASLEGYRNIVNSDNLPPESIIEMDPRPEYLGQL